MDLDQRLVMVVLDTLFQPYLEIQYQHYNLDLDHLIITLLVVEEVDHMEHLHLQLVVVLPVVDWVLIEHREEIH